MTPAEVERVKKYERRKAVIDQVLDHMERALKMTRNYGAPSAMLVAMCVGLVYASIWIADHVIEPVVKQQVATNVVVAATQQDMARSIERMAMTEEQIANSIQRIGTLDQQHLDLLREIKEINKQAIRLASHQPLWPEVGTAKVE